MWLLVLFYAAIALAQLGDIEPSNSVHGPGSWAPWYTDSYTTAEATSYATASPLPDSSSNWGFPPASSLTLDSTASTDYDTSPTESGLPLSAASTSCTDLATTTIVLSSTVTRTVILTSDSEPPSSSATFVPGPPESPIPPSAFPPTSTNLASLPATTPETSETTGASTSVSTGGTVYSNSVTTLTSSIPIIPVPSSTVVNTVTATAYTTLVIGTSEVQSPGTSTNVETSTVGSYSGGSPSSSDTDVGGGSTSSTTPPAQGTTPVPSLVPLSPPVTTTESLTPPPPETPPASSVPSTASTQPELSTSTSTLTTVATKTSTTSGTHSSTSSTGLATHTGGAIALRATDFDVLFVGVLGSVVWSVALGL